MTISTRRITRPIEKFLRTRDLSWQDEKILNDCLKAQQEYAQLTIKRWKQIERMLKLPQKEKENGS